MPDPTKSAEEQDYLNNMEGSNMFDPDSNLPLTNDDMDISDSEENNPLPDPESNEDPSDALLVSPTENLNINNNTKDIVNLQNAHSSENKRLIKKLEDKLNLLTEEAIELTNKEEIDLCVHQMEHLEHLLNKLHKRSQPNHTTKPIASNTELNIQNKINKNDIPVFQLIDDDSLTKNNNKSSYESAEGFISAFQSLILFNDANIDEVWSKYLPISFQNNNKKYQRFFNMNIRDLPPKTRWAEVKDIILQRFGEFANNTLKVKNFLDLKQNRTETIRDYMDRYAEAYSRALNGENKSTSIECARFIHTLLPFAKTEIELSLKNKNLATKSGTIYPDSLQDLFTFLSTNMGDIQEAISIAFFNKEKNKNKIESDNTQNKRRIDFNHHNNDQPNKKINNPCRWCHKFEHSIAHLNSCPPYKESDVYKKYLQKLEDRKNYNKK
ncbi:hypothetical protein K501DRAFT_281148, partial [Backusella circina FSU 941]